MTVPMPFQLAVFSPASATEVIATHPEIKTWAIAGHSLGGSMAARYAHHHPDNVQGLLLWDAYPADDMSASELPVRMIHRSDQAGNPPESYLPHLAKMPPQGDYYPLKGAQHLNFGSFIAGRMYADEPPPEMDPAQQQQLVVAGSVEFLREL